MRLIYLSLDVDISIVRERLNKRNDVDAETPGSVSP